MEVRKKRPRGSTEPPETPISFSLGGTARAVGVKGLEPVGLELGVDIKVILTPPCIFCIENR